MIVSEERFRDLFATIPTYPLESEPEGQSLPLVYWWGEQKELNRVLIEKHKNHESAYPLLWYLLPNEEIEIGLNSPSNRVRSTYQFVLAMNTKYDWFNDQRWDSTFAQYLFPYYELVKQALKKSGIVDLKKIDGANNYFRYTKLPNYGVPTTFEGKDAAKQKDFWDAILFEFDGVLNDNCIADIKYNLKF